MAIGISEAHEGLHVFDIRPVTRDGIVQYIIDEYTLFDRHIRRDGGATTHWWLKNGDGERVRRTFPLSRLYLSEAGALEMAVRRTDSAIERNKSALAKLNDSRDRMMARRAELGVTAPIRTLVKKEMKHA